MTWHTVVDEQATNPGSGRSYRRVAHVALPGGAVQAAWPGAQATLAPLEQDGGDRRFADQRQPGRPQGHAGHTVRAPMAARVLAVHVAPGDCAALGQALVVLEAMKMEHTVVSPMADGQAVARLCVAVGEQVTQGQILIEFVPEAAS